MKIVIIEDEKPSARLLKRKVEALNGEVLAMLGSVEEAVVWFRSNEHPEIILADIQLSDGLSFEIFEQLTVESAVIFTTAYDEYALKAFKLNSIDYLLKPIDEAELKNALEKYTSRHTKNIVDVESLRKLYQKDYKKRYTVKAGNYIKIIDATDIECFYSAYKGTYLVQKEGRAFPLEESLDALERECNPEEFFRVNRQFIVALKAIREISVYSNSRLRIFLNNYSENEIVVSRERVQAFKQWIS